MKKYKCIIFDCDGVLVDTESITNSILVDMSLPLGLHMSLEEAIKEFSGRSIKDCLKIIEEKTGKEIPPHFELEYRKTVLNELKKGVKPVPGIPELLEKLSLDFCVASSGPMNKIHLNLETSGLLQYFEGNIFSCYDIESWKPEPDIFIHAAKKMGYSPNECLVIEDSIAGIQSAKAGGFDVYGFQTHVDLSNEIPTRTFSNMRELSDLLVDSVSHSSSKAHFQFSLVMSPDELDILKGKEAFYNDIHFYYSKKFVEELKEKLNKPHAFQILVKINSEFVAYFASHELFWKDYLFVVETFVMPEYQGLGLGTELMQRAIDFAKQEGLKGLMTQTEHNNIPAQKFYKKNGFIEIDNPEWDEGITYQKNL